MCLESLYPWQERRKVQDARGGTKGSLLDRSSGANSSFRCCPKRDGERADTKDTKEIQPVIETRTEEKAFDCADCWEGFAATKSTYQSHLLVGGSEESSFSSEGRGREKAFGEKRTDGPERRKQNEGAH